MLKRNSGRKSVLAIFKREKKFVPISSLRAKHRVPLAKPKKMRRPINKSKLLIIFGILLGCILIALIIIGVRSNPFLIRNFRFTTQASCIEPSKIQGSILQKEKNIFFLKTKILEDKILEQYPCLESIKIKKVYPNTLEVATIARQKVLTVSLFVSNLDARFKQLEATSSTQTAQVAEFIPNPNEATESGVYAIDKSDVIFANSSREDGIPTVNLFDEYVQIGRKIGNGFTGKVLESIKKIQEDQISIESINIKGASVYINAKPSIKLSLNKDIERQLITLQLILQKAKIESKTVTQVDLRFDKAVVVY